MKALRIYILLLIVLMTSSGQAGEKYPFLIHPHAPRSVATAWGAEKFYFNPAALRTNMSAQLGYYHSFKDSTFNGDNAVIFSRGGVGAAYHHLTLLNNPGLSSWSLGLAAGQTKDFLVGGSYTLYKTDLEGYDNAHFWKFGILMQPQNNFSLGFVADNINGMKFEGDRTDVEYTLGLGYRPFGKELTLAADYEFYSGERFKDGHLTGFTEIRLKEGLWVSGHIDEDGAFGAGLSFAFGSTHTRGYTVFDKNTEMSHGTIEYNIFADKKEHAALAPKHDVRLNLSGAIPEDTHAGFLWADPPRTFTEMIIGVRDIADDSHVTSISLYIDNPGLGWAQLEELRDEIEGLKSRGKTVTAFLAPLSGTGSYYLASVADRIAMQKVDAISLTGLLGTVTYYTGTLDKLGIEAELEYIGKYKSMAYTLTRDSISPYHAEQVNDLLDDIYDEVVSAIASARNIDLDSLAAIIDNAPVPSIEAKEIGLIDAIMYPDEFAKWARENGSSNRQSEFWSYISTGEQSPDWGEPYKIAVVPVTGSMVYGDSYTSFWDGQSTGSDVIVGAIRRARNMPHVRALVLRVNTPGGEVLGGEAIYRELQRTREKIPVIVSMSNVAASGGYYIAAASDSIFSDRTTVTGSIGVVYGKAVLEELRDKIGLSTFHFKRGENSDIYSASSHYTKSQRAEVRRQVELVYENFVRLVADSRNMSYDAVDSLGRGRTYSGLRAHRVRLIDEIGGIGDAINAAIRSSGIDHERTEVVVLPTRDYFTFPTLDPIALAQGALSHLIGDSNHNALLNFRPAGVRGLYLLPPYEIEIR